MLDLIRIKNFKALRNLETRLAPLTVLAGPNACGKTSVLHALYLLSRLRRDELETVFSGRYAPEVVLTQGSGSDLLLQVYRIRPEERRPRLRMGCYVAPAAESARPHSRWAMELQPSMVPFFQKHMPSAFLAELRVSEMAEPSPREEADEELPSTGRGLPSLLATLKLTTPRQYEHLLASLRAVVPAVNDLRFEAVQIGEEHDWFDPIAPRRKAPRKRPGFQFRFEMTNGAIVPAHSASEGTLLTLGLLTVLSTPNRPKLILLDNIDAGLHPRAGGELIGQLRKIMSNEPDLQIVVTTHSPYVLDHFQPQEIRLMTSDDAGHAIIGSLTDHPQFERWKEEMLPGEFWSTVGEDWLKKRETQGA